MQHLHDQHEPSAKVPNANYIPLVRIVSAEARIGSRGGSVGSPDVFRYRLI